MQAHNLFSKLFMKSLCSKRLLFSSFIISPVVMALSLSSSPQRLVLVGGGHAHAQVIKALNKASRPKNLQVTLIDLEQAAAYSGMIPGCIAGFYKAEDTLLKLKPLAKWASIDFVHDRVVDIDLERNLIKTQNQGSIPFDAVSIDIGSASRGLDDCPGARQYSLPTRPITELVRRLNEECTKLAKNPHPTHVVVIGGGAAGIELSLSIKGRFQRILGKDYELRVTLLDSGLELFPDETLANRQAIAKILADKRIDVQHGCTVSEVCEDSVRLGTGEEIDFTLCLWATGAGAHDLARKLEQKGLAVSDRGWIRVNPELQSVSHPNIFAAGDCCTIERLEGGPPPKAGVYAVRAGPILIKNLVNYLSMGPLQTYVPQDDFLKLISCGDGTALGFRFGIPIHGKWVWQLKDAIDSKFLDLFKEENLPELKEGQAYDTSQYDASNVERPPPKVPKDAAVFLQRTDDDVDFEEAWNVLRDMAADQDYQNRVLDYMELPEYTAVTR
jgi:selenide,water dikinase